jgi:hypothetical protein
VNKASGDKKVGGTKVSEVLDKKGHKHSGPLYHAIDSIVDEPYTNGLNAETTAGLAIAKSVMDASSGQISNSLGDFAMTKRHVPPGITSAGFFDEDAEE